MLHKPILSTYHEISLIEFDPMPGKSLQEPVSSLYLCVLGGFLMHEGVQTLLLCDAMYVIKNWPFDPKIAPLYSLFIEKWSKQTSYLLVAWLTFPSFLT